jgi:hypothetical protein
VGSPRPRAAKSFGAAPAPADGSGMSVVMFNNSVTTAIVFGSKKGQTKSVDLFQLTEISLILIGVFLQIKYRVIKIVCFYLEVVL